MDWPSLLAKRIVEERPPDRAEIDDLRKIIARDLHNAAVDGLTEDGRFLFAYMAVRSLASLAIRVEGYRVTDRGGAHFNTFQALRAVGGVSGRAEYFDRCRRKRNEASYEVVLVSQAEADGLLAVARAFHEEVEAWIAKAHPAWRR
jgi:hypothetical protein